MNKKFNLFVEQLPILMDELKRSTFMPWSKLRGLPNSGIYVFYENDEPIYVGRTNRMYNRLKEHGRASSGHNKAPFAFNLARKQFGVSILTRGELEQNKEFSTLFEEAKVRISKCLCL